MSRKYMPLIIGGVVAVLLAGLLFFFVFSVRDKYATGQNDLEVEKRKFLRLNSRAVFPMADNVATMTKQREVYQEYYEEVLGALRAGQPEAQHVSRDSFRRMIEDDLRRLASGARAANVTLPPNFAFGFTRYAEGNLPQDEEIERLVDQLRSVATLCSILYEAGVGELTSVERTVFEKNAQVAPKEEEYSGRFSRMRDERVVQEAPSTDLYRDPDGLFTREHYILAYRAQDAANRKVLDRLAQGRPFTIVTKMEVINSAKPVIVLPKTAEEKAPEPASPPQSRGWQSAGAAKPLGVKDAPAILPRDLRVVAGQEMPNIRIEVDVYRLADHMAEEEVQP